MATLAFAALGAWVAPAGYAALGWSIGSMVGQYVMGGSSQTSEVEGPKLGDLSFQYSENGGMIPQFWGNARVSANVIWARPLLETQHTSSTTEEASGGKGGGGSAEFTVTNTWYTYSADFAICVGKGVSILKKVWANNNLVIDLTAPTGSRGLIYENGSVEFHNGSETQLADAYILSFDGATKTPAYRGVAYLVFRHLELAPYGNAIPQLKFELEVPE